MSAGMYICSSAFDPSVLLTREPSALRTLPSIAEFTPPRRDNGAAELVAALLGAIMSDGCCGNRPMPLVRMNEEEPMEDGLEVGCDVRL